MDPELIAAIENMGAVGVMIAVLGYLIKVTIPRQQDQFLKAMMNVQETCREELQAERETNAANMKDVVEQLRSIGETIARHDAVFQLWAKEKGRTGE